MGHIKAFLCDGVAGPGHFSSADGVGTVIVLPLTCWPGHATGHQEQRESRNIGITLKTQQKHTKKLLILWANHVKRLMDIATHLMSNAHLMTEIQ